MDGNGSLEQRVAALEQEVAELKRHAGNGDRNWPDRLFGAMRDLPEEDFREFVRLGKEFRGAQIDPEESPIFACAWKVRRSVRNAIDHRDRVG